MSQINLTAVLQELEEKRLLFKAKLRRLLFIFLGITAVFVILVVLFSDNPVFIVAPIVIFGGIYAFIWNSDKSKLTNLFKTDVLVPAITSEFPGISYQSNPGIHRDDFLASKLYSGSEVDRYTSEDVFEGMHGSTHFRFCEIHAERKQQRTDSKGRTKTHYVTIFQGVFMIADFNKKLSYTTRVMQARDNFFEKLFNRKTKVSLEHPVFERIFNTYSDDQVEARYILSPAMMERILKLQKSWNDKINLSFKGNHVYIAINHSENLFEPDTGKHVDMSQVQRIFDEIKGCIQIIDTLDLNTRIWTKQ